MPPLQETVNRKTEMRVGTRTQQGFVYSSLTRPCPDTTVIQLKGTSKILLSALESLLRASQSAQVTVSCKTQGQPTDTYKHTPRHAHTHTHAHTRLHSSSHLEAQSVLAHFSSLFQTQQQPKLPLSKSSSKAKQLYGPERCLRADESECHTSIRTAYTLDLGILSYWYPDVGPNRSEASLHAGG